MPGGDRTGPLGQGPLTGRGLGLCGNYSGRARGLGRGQGFQRGFGRGRAFLDDVGSAAAPLEQRVDELTAEISALKAEIAATKSRDNN